MERILSIYCSGGMGREIADMAYRINVNEKKWSNVIFVDDNIVNRVVDDVEVYTLDEALEKFDNDYLDLNCLGIHQLVVEPSYIQEL